MIADCFGAVKQRPTSSFRTVLVGGLQGDAKVSRSTPDGILAPTEVKSDSAGRGVPCGFLTELAVLSRCPSRATRSELVVTETLGRLLG